MGLQEKYLYHEMGGCGPIHLGRWTITGKYKDVELSFVVWVVP